MGQWKAWAEAGPDSGYGVDLGVKFKHSVET